MINFSQLLAEKKDEIVLLWIQAIKEDRHISSDDTLSSSAVRNHIPRVIDAMVTVLSRSQENDWHTLVEASLDHGVLRAEQGFTPVEIAREYRLLRQQIFVALEAHLLNSEALEVFRVFRIVDAVVDEAISQCFKSYVDERFRELQTIQNQLSLTNEELNRLVRVNQDSLSHLVHEFKTPLNSIIGYSELLLRQQRRSGVTDSLPSIDNIERVLRNGQQLLRLVNDVLEIARYDSGMLQLQLAITDVAALIANVVEIIEPLAGEHDLAIVLDCDHAPAQVLTDPIRLQQILTNLLSNAVRYTQSGSITISCRVDSAKDWSIAIVDTGVGIAPDDQANIFEPYFRVASNKQAQNDGTGLGLAIVARLVHLLQGKIELTSQVNVGSTFKVTLPLEVQVVNRKFTLVTE